MQDQPHRWTHCSEDTRNITKDRFMTIKVIQWATGQLGAEALKTIIQRPEYELVGVLVYSDAKHGKDAGELVGLPPTGIRATKNKEEIFALNADLVIHSPQFQESMAEHDADVIRLLESGKNVISMMGYFNPEALGKEYSEPLLAACRRGKSTLFGTGIDPGFVSERLATTLTGLCTEVRHVHVIESYDCSCAYELMATVMGFGMEPDVFKNSYIPAMWDRFFWGIPHEVIERLGGEIEKTERSFEIKIADEDVTSRTPIPVKKGTVIGSSFSFSGHARGRKLFTLTTQWWIGKPIEGWVDKSGWTIEIDGTPSLKQFTQVAPSLAAIANDEESAYNPALMTALVLNAAEDVIAAEPGFFRAPVFGTWKVR